MKLIGERISKLRKSKNLTQILLGEKLNVSDKTISSWDSNRTEPNLEDLLKLSEILECTVTYLLYGNITKNDIETEIKIELTNDEYNKLEKTLNKNSKFINEMNQKDTYYEPSYRKFYKKTKKRMSG